MSVLFIKMLHFTCHFCAVGLTEQIMYNVEWKIYSPFVVL